MSYKSKRTIASMVAGVLLLAAYAMYAVRKSSLEPVTLKAWAVTMLVFIGSGIVALILMQIVFHIVYSIGIAVKSQECDEKNVERVLSCSMAEDEMDKLISLKSAHACSVCIGVGFVAALVGLALDASAVMALHMLFGAFSVGSLLEGGICVYLYEKGVQHG